MENFLLHCCSLILVAILLTFTTLRLVKPKSSSLNLPPSPPSLPIIGHLHLISLPFHHYLSRLSERYGPIVSLRFGSFPVLVVSSPLALKECFSENDVIFANRPFFPSGRHLTYDYTVLPSAPYGPLWRNLRRISTIEIFSSSPINSQTPVRQEENRAITKELFKRCGDDGGAFTEVDMTSMFEKLTLNVTMKILAGKRYFWSVSTEVSEEGHRFQNLVREILHLSNAGRPEHFLPFLMWIGVTGPKKRLLKLEGEADLFFEELIEERRRKMFKNIRESGSVMTQEEMMVIDRLLQLQLQKDGDNISEQLIKGTILTFLVAGTDTSSVTMGWAMSLLLNHQEVLKKIRDEIDMHVGTKRLIDESDLPNLHYLNNAVKETLRLFPAAPVLLPHQSSDHCKVGGYDIVAGTMLLPNAYAIHRDPNLWNEPTRFKPERFEGDISSNGVRIYFPFGMGRRNCPGEVLAMRMVSLALGTLIQCFEWERIGQIELDMSEGIGITMPRAIPLEVKYKTRDVMVNLLRGL